MRKFLRISLIISLMGLLLTGCGGETKESTKAQPATLPYVGPQFNPGDPEASGAEESSAAAGFVPAETPEESEPQTAAPAETQESIPAAEKVRSDVIRLPELKEGESVSLGTPYDTDARYTCGRNGFLICIDAGHQAQANTDKEPIGPGAEETKTKVSSGTQGRFTGVPEYQVNLNVARYLEQELLKRGYSVLMVRTSHEVNISNSERADIANSVDADVFIRIHCNGVDDASVEGAGAICQSKSNVYVGQYYEEWYGLCSNIVDAVCSRTGQHEYGVITNDAMAGINWCRVPTALIEMAFMTNEGEDRMMVTADYQQKAALGMADGIQYYLMSREPKNHILLAESLSETEEPAQSVPTEAPTAAPTQPTPTQAPTAAPTQPTPTEAPTASPTQPAPAEAPTLTPAQTTETAAPETEPSADPFSHGPLICIDAGHQSRENTGTEPNGPGSSQMKQKVSAGTRGVSSGVPEYKVNLQIAKKLEQELKNRGYRVLMCRSSDEVDISNVARAQMANNAGADIFLRLHCNEGDPSWTGISGLIMSAGNPYNGALHDSTEKLAKALLTKATAATGARWDGVIERDDMTGINWCKMPVVLLEMGYMSNAGEDRLLTDDAYQNRLAAGIANGVDSYFGR